MPISGYITSAICPYMGISSHGSYALLSQIKPANIVRDAVSHELILIDLDAAAEFGDIVGQKAQHGLQPNP